MDKLTSHFCVPCLTSSNQYKTRILGVICTQAYEQLFCTVSEVCEVILSLYFFITTQIAHVAWPISNSIGWAT